VGRSSVSIGIARYYKGKAIGNSELVTHWKRSELVTRRQRKKSVSVWKQKRSVLQVRRRRSTVPSVGPEKLSVL
jgi:hypothetical protein